MLKNLLIIFIFKIYFSYIIIPFYRSNLNLKPSKINFDLFEYFQYQKIFINLNIGNSSITSTFNFNNSNFLVIDYEPSYNSSLLLNEKNQITTNTLKGYKIEDNMIIEAKNKKLSVNNIPFIKVNEFLINNEDKNTNNNAIIGLKNGDLNLFNNLKNLKIINFNIFSFIYKNNNEGELFIGDYPHESRYNYNKNNLIIFKGYNSKNWEFSFDSIKVGNFEIGYSHEIDFTMAPIIIAPRVFRKKIKELFFGKLFNESKCFKEKKYDEKEEMYIEHYYYCDINQNIDYSLFPSIKFEFNNPKVTFELTYKDLFKEINGKKYLTIILKKYDDDKWVLGDIFLKKYTLVFNNDKKEIGFYLKKDGLNIKINPWIIVMILSTILSIVLLCWIRNVFFAPKRAVPSSFEYNVNQPNSQSNYEKLDIN